MVYNLELMYLNLFDEYMPFYSCEDTLIPQKLLHVDCVFLIWVLHINPLCDRSHTRFSNNFRTIFRNNDDYPSSFNNYIVQYTIIEMLMLYFSHDLLFIISNGETFLLDMILFWSGRFSMTIETIIPRYHMDTDDISNYTLVCYPSRKG